MLEQPVHHDCDATSCSDCPFCDVCDWCETCTDCHSCECPSDSADNLLHWLENHHRICKNCFRVKYPTDTERGHIELDGHPYEEFFHYCGTGEQTPASVHRMWGADDPNNLPVSGDGLTFSRVLDRVLTRLEELYVPVDRDAAFAAALEKKQDSELWSTRDRDCILYAIDTGVDLDTVFEELGRDGLDRVADHSY